MWALPAGGIAISVLFWYLSSSIEHGFWIGGGSAAGLSCGILAALMIVFEMLLWPRKKWRSVRLGPARHWMAAHIWFGLACFPLAVAHSGFRFGGTLTTILVVLLALTVLSGIYGLVLQNIVPKAMLVSLSSETIYSQIDNISRQNFADAIRLLSAVFPYFEDERAKRYQLNEPGVGDGKELFGAQTPQAELDAKQTMLVGAMHTQGKMKGIAVRTVEVQPAKYQGDAHVLWKSLEEIRPFLLAGRSAQGPVTNRLNASSYFDKLRANCHSESKPLIDALEQWTDQRHQFDRQRTLHHLLHGWIPLHVAVSVALTVLLLVHVITAFRYW